MLTSNIFLWGVGRGEDNSLRLWAIEHKPLRAAEQAPVWSQIEHKSASLRIPRPGLGEGKGDWNWLLLRFCDRVRSSDGPLIKRVTSKFDDNELYREQTGSVTRSRMSHFLCGFYKVVS